MMTAAELEIWRRVERAIAERAHDLCQAGCPDYQDDGRCAGCGAGRDPGWRRDALRSLAREALEVAS